MGNETVRVRELFPQEFSATLGARGVRIVDVRTVPEFVTVHAEGAVNVPLDELDRANLFADKNQPICFTCKSGQRASKAAQAAVAAGMTEVYCLTGGTDAWVTAGLPVVRGQSKVISLERQVRIAAGAMALLGAVLAWFVHPAFAWLSGFVGAGLMFAGITDTCGMGLILARMPWNKGVSSSSCRSSD